MARTKETRANAAPGAGTIFTLRAIGLVLAARWFFSMSQMNLTSALTAMASSPWACINLVFLFLLIFQPGARAVAERPFHPLPQWLRQALRLFAFLGLLFALWSVGAFVASAGWRRAMQAVAATNGWLVAAPVLYAAVLWICRPRPLWRTNVAARRFAIGRYAVSLDALTRTVVVWAERRKVGQYDARELSVRWANGPAARPTPTPTPAVAFGAAGEPGASAAPIASVAAPALTRGAFGMRPKVELLWDSPAAAGHNRQTVFRAALMTEGDRVAARALDATLRQV
ncbi:hypothetical protein LJ656_20340 [Paraburkholderia sp. MMS20-SJTR3]|uniref:Uncharacterized protein n=1 Tax=Paraburkholderia sejongensis TaxID=2886946 RepID=A0ABS8JYG5_9BURK|nr:hypothetical protein [Paraburkholderia sp. MMS20-SJTR3]MCC8394947.1 hypothetical protein [Paraburkholderia sp. MMS20-SJTR3]